MLLDAGPLYFPAHEAIMVNSSPWSYWKINIVIPVSSPVQLNTTYSKISPRGTKPTLTLRALSAAALHETFPTHGDLKANVSNERSVSPTRANECSTYIYITPKLHSHTFPIFTAQSIKTHHAQHQNRPSPSSRRHPSRLPNAPPLRFLQTYPRPRKLIHDFFRIISRPICQ